MPVKNGFLTSEFYVTLIVQIVGVLAALGYLSPDAADIWEKAAVQIGGLLAQVVSAAYYNWSRKNVKISSACTPEVSRETTPKKPGIEIIGVSLIALAFAASCTYNTGAVPYSSMTPKEKASFFMSVYNKQYDNYVDVFTKPGELTDEQKEIMRKKRDLLGKVYPLIANYADYVAAGTVPSADKEQAIIKLLDQLATMMN